MRYINRSDVQCLLVTALSLLSCASHGQEVSLADQANAAKAYSHQQPESNVFRQTVSGDYHNEFLGFRVRHIAGWTSMSRGMMNVNEAIGRDALGLHAGINQSASRVFGMYDEAGSSIIVTIVRIPEGEATDSATVKADLARVAKAQLPSPHIADETVLLDDNSHHFSAVRLSYMVRDTPMFQSMQLLLLPQRGYAVSLTASAPSEEELERLLHQLQASLQWDPKQQGN